MNRANRVRSLALLILVGCLAVTLSAYRDRQAMARLEGNRLYSADAVAAAMTPADAVSLVRELGGENRAFIDLDGNGSARAIFIANQEDFRLPSSNGAGFRNEGGPQAIVGSKVDIQRSESGQATEIDGKSYPVVGILGAADDSLLAYDVLIADDEPFRHAPSGSVVTFDGPDAPAAARAAMGSAVMPVRPGAADRTNVDIMSPVIVRLGTGTLTLSSVLSGVIIASLLMPWISVSFILGRTRRELFALSSVHFARVAVPAALAAWALSWATKLPGGPLAPGGLALGAALSCAFVAMHVSIWRSSPWK